MADRNKPGYMNFDDIADRIESGKLNAYDTVYTKDTHEVVFIKEDKSLIRMKCRLDVYPSVVVAEYNLNLNTDTYVGQIVGIEDGEWVRLYNVNYADDKFIVKQVGINEYGQLVNKPQINGVTLEGNKTTAQLGIDIPTKFSQLYDDIGYETIDHLVANYYSKTETYSKTEADSLFATQNSVPTDLADLQDDSTHRLVTDEDKYRWNNPVGNVQADWNTTDPADGSYIKNKPSLFSGNYNDLSNKPDIPDDLADLNEDTTHRLVTDAEKTAWNGKSDFSGSYTDLTNKPTLADLSTDSGHRTVSDSEKSTWNGKSDFSGSYNDLSNKPSIPDDLADLDDVSISNIQNGQILKYNSTTQKFENSNESGGTVSSAYKKIKVASSEIIASGEDTLEFVAGTNITLVPDTVNKKVTINSSGGGGTSTGDMLKSIYDTNNDGIVNAADEAATLTGLNATVTELNALDGVTSNVQEQLNAKADSSDVPTALSDLSDDSTHRLVTDTEKTTWNGKSDFSGSYNDLTDKPSIPDDLADLNDDSAHRLVTDAEKTAWNGKSDFSGSYADLTNKPTIPDAQVQADWNESDNSKVDYIKNKPTIPDAQIQSDWNQSDNTKKDYIKNKPTIPSALADLSDDSTHRLVTDTEKTAWGTGEANVQSNWNETDTDSDAYIQNKPTIPSVVANPGNTTATLTSLGLDGTNYALPSGGGGTITDVQVDGQSVVNQGVANIDLTSYAKSSDLGTASAKDVPASGDAGNDEVVLGNDSRLSDARTPVSHTHTTSDITDFPTMSDYIQKSNTSGLVKNDGTIDTNSYATTSQIPDISGKADKVTSAVNGNFAGLDSNGNLTDSGHKHSDYLTQHQDISGKADKVTGATNGNLAKLDANGNLADGGWSSDKTTTSATGNPISISGLKSNQLAINPMVTFEPIQAGSGTPSPSNVRAISGYDKIEVLSSKNVLHVLGQNPNNGYADDHFIDNNGNLSSSAFNGYVTEYSVIKPNTTYTLTVGYDGIAPSICFYDSNKNFIEGIKYNRQAVITFTTASNAAYCRASVANTSKYATYLEEGTTPTAYVKTTDLSESLGQTVYGGTLDVRTGVLTVDRAIKDLGDFTWTYSSTAGFFYSNLGFVGNSALVCSQYDNKLPSSTETSNNIIGVSGNGQLRCKDSRYTDASLFKTAVTGAKLVFYDTPFTIQLTPHEISLLKDYAYVSTNGTGIAFDYHNGEIASLSDISQLGETVNELDQYIKNVRELFTYTFNGSTTWQSALYDISQKIKLLSKADIRRLQLQYDTDNRIFNIVKIKSNYWQFSITCLDGTSYIDTFIAVLDAINLSLNKFIMIRVQSDSSVTYTDGTANTPSNGTVIKVLLT